MDSIGRRLPAGWEGRGGGKGRVWRDKWVKFNLFMIASFGLVIIKYKEELSHELMKSIHYIQGLLYIV